MRTPHSLRPRCQRGQGMTEYIIIVGVVAILSIAVVTQFGDTLRMWWTAIGERFTGVKDTKIENQMNPDFRKTPTDL